MYIYIYISIYIKKSQKLVIYIYIPNLLTTNIPYRSSTVFGAGLGQQCFDRCLGAAVLTHLAVSAWWSGVVAAGEIFFWGLEVGKLENLSYVILC